MGRPVGSKNRKAREWALLGKYITQKGAAKAMKIMMEKEGDDFLASYEKMLRFFKPSMSTATVKQEGEINLSIVSDDKKLIDKV